MNTQMPAQAAKAINMLRGAGFRAVPVGGCVRDLLRGGAPHDWDIATSAFPDEMKQVFCGERLVETGLRHGTLTVIMDRIPVEITSFRADGEYSDGRRPDAVRFTRSLEEDLSRRDFTINALCLDEAGGVIDLFGGRQDLERGVIRCIGSPDRRFEEDALRILRALRFSASFGFTIEEGTDAALLRHLPRLKLLAAERVLSELEGLLCAPDVTRVLMEYPQALCAVFPPLGVCVGLAQPPKYHDSDVYGHTARAVGAVPVDFGLRLAMLLHDVGKPACADGEGHFYGHDREGALLCGQALEALRCSAALRMRVTRLVRLHHLPLSPQRVRLRRLLARYGEATLRDLAAVQRADSAAQALPWREQRARELQQFETALDALLSERPAFTRKQLAIHGGDLLSLGVPEGRQLGATLRYLLREVIEERLPNERETLMAAALGFQKEGIDWNRLHYLPLRGEHLGLMAKLWTDPEVIRFTAVERPCTPRQSKLRLQALLDSQKGLLAPTLYLVLCDENPCGVVGCPPIGRDQRRFGLFYQFLPQFWGKGIGEQAVGWMVRQMKEHYPQASLFADVVGDNAASVRILQKMGFVADGVRTGAFEREGKRFDILPFHRAAE